MFEIATERIKAEVVQCPDDGGGGGEQSHKPIITAIAIHKIYSSVHKDSVGAGAASSLSLGTFQPSVGGRCAVDLTE